MQVKKNLSATALKYIVILTMTIDHIAYCFVPFGTPLFYIMRSVGRLTAPTMSFFIAEGVCHTHSKQKYLLRMTIFALISQPFYFIVDFNRLPQSALEFCTNLNVMFNFSATILLLILLTQKNFSVIYAFAIAVCVGVSSVSDWSMIIPVWTAIFYFFRKNNKVKTILFIIISIAFTTIKNINFLSSVTFQYAVILTPLFLIFFYNGERQKTSSTLMKKINKWVFYLYYPFHLAVIAFIVLIA